MTFLRLGLRGSASAEPDGLTSLAGPAGYEVTLRPVSSELVTTSGRSGSLRQGMDLTADITTRQETALRLLSRRTGSW
jgi:hypothetical protein